MCIRDRGGDAPKPAEDGALLAAPPGKREDESEPLKWVHPDGSTETSLSKGKKYHPEDVDNRKSSGPRKRARNAKYAKEKGGSSKRNVFPGLGSFRTLSKGIYENKRTNYFEGEEIESLNEELNKFFSKSTDPPHFITMMSFEYLVVYFFTSSMEGPLLGRIFSNSIY